MGYEAIIYEKKKRVALITFNRPEKMNALNETLRGDIEAALHDAEQDDEVRSIVMTGNGRAWSAGADMSRERDATRDNGRDLIGWYNSTEQSFERQRAMRRLHKPIVAAINGYALGAGFELLITCDLLVASERAVMGAPELRHGSIVATWLPFIVGPMWAKRIILTGDHVSAQTAKDIGLVIDVVPHDQLLPKAMELAERIALVPPLAVRFNKRMIDGVMEMMGVEHGLQYGALVSAICHAGAMPLAETADGRKLSEVREKEGVRGFLEARDGPFGRVPI